MERTAKQLQRLKVSLRKKELELSEIIRSREVMSGQGVSETDALSHILVQVQDALRRIQFKAYGVCIACGNQIDWHRLEEIPWTPYCQEDESKYSPAAPLKKAVATGKG